MHEAVAAWRCVCVLLSVCFSLCASLSMCVCLYRPVHCGGMKSSALPAMASTVASSTASMQSLGKRPSRQAAKRSRHVSCLRTARESVKARTSVNVTFYSAVPLWVSRGFAALTTAALGRICSLFHVCCTIHSVFTDSACADLWASTVDAPPRERPATPEKQSLRSTGNSEPLESSRKTHSHETAFESNDRDGVRKPRRLPSGRRQLTALERRAVLRSSRWGRTGVANHLCSVDTLLAIVGAKGSCIR